MAHSRLKIIEVDSTRTFLPKYDAYVLETNERAKQLFEDERYSSKFVQPQALNIALIMKNLSLSLTLDSPITSGLITY